MPKKKVQSDNNVEQPPTREGWFGDETASPDPFGPRYDMTKSPFVVKGVNPASDPNLSAEERLEWLTKQHEAMHK